MALTWASSWGAKAVSTRPVTRSYLSRKGVEMGALVPGFWAVVNVPPTNTLVPTSAIA